jgi:ribonuclease Z
MNRFRCAAAGILMFTILSGVKAQRPPEMELILLGTGYPFPSAERAGPSCAIVIGERYFIVDAGRGVVMRLAAAGVSWDSVAAVFLTHLHSDHIDGLPDLFHCTWQFGAGMPFELYGPKETKEIVDGILQFYEPDIHIRRDLTEKLPAKGARINLHETKEGIVYDDPGRVRVTAFLVDHSPVEPAFGYRFDTARHSVVITGDTRPNSNLIRHARGADVLVHEAYVNPGLPSRTEAARHWTIYDYHSSAREAGEVAEKAGVKVLVLTHLIPGNISDQIFLNQAKREFKGKIVVGRDLMRIRPSDDPD